MQFTQKELLKAKQIIETLLNEYPEYDIQMYASTVEINAITRECYDWKLLRKWCKEQGLEVPKYDYCNLMINEYPDVAWQAVYGLDISKLIYRQSA